MRNVIVKFVIGEPKEVAARTFRFIASTDEIDRQGESIDQDGWVLDRFKENPVILAAHDYRSLPVARATSIGVVNNRLLVDIEFPPEGTTRASDEAYRLVKAAVLRAVSVGFRPLEEPVEEQDSAGDWYVRWPKNELLEVSLVAIPANASALIAASIGSRGVPIFRCANGDAVTGADIAQAFEHGIQRAALGAIVQLRVLEHVTARLLGVRAA